jgi:hypothetical protein
MRSQTGCSSRAGGNKFFPLAALDDDPRTPDLGDDRLTKRGNAAFQARLDKTLLAMHVLLAYHD